MITGRIYALTDFFMYYYGSSETELYYRKMDHINASKRKNTQCYMYFRNIGWDNVYMILIEEGQFEDTKALRKREGEIITLHINKDYCLNCRIAGRSCKDTQKAYREKRKLTQHQNPYPGS